MRPGCYITEAGVIVFLVSHLILFTIDQKNISVEFLGEAQTSETDVTIVIYGYVQFVYVSPESSLKQAILANVLGKQISRNDDCFCCL